MSYNKDFYQAYENYLNEPQVRDAHNWVFSLLPVYYFQNVVDLGCGQFNEFREHGGATLYTGIDQNITTTNNGQRWALLKGDYRDKACLKSTITTQGSFVSLFSTEITAPYVKNYKLYNWIFKAFPNIQMGLVSGFYYTDKTTHNPVLEAGGVISFQTLEKIEGCNRVGFSEKRILVHVPSKMFGQDVIEVWKIFKRE